MKEQPVLQTPRLLLRAFTPADAADVQRLAGASEVADTTLSVPHPYKDGMAQVWIAGHAAQFASGKVITYAVTLKDTGELTGVVSLATALHHRRAELAYWTGVPFWNQGYTTEASAALLEYGFDSLGLNKATASHFTRNPASGRVMQKLGMEREGLLRAHFLKGDTFEDVAVYGILAEQWRDRSGADRRQ